MAQANTVFKRYEKKYMLKGNQYACIRKYIEPYMQEDEYGLSMICNIYYDTQNFDLASRSLDKPVYKEKLRLRSYGVPTENQTVYLEVKKKYDGIVYKRRIPLTLKDAKKSIKSRKITGELAEEQIARELNYYMQRYQPVPATYLAYDRIAMYGKEDESIRITFDFNIRSRQEDMALEKGDKGELLLPEDYVIMEIKVNNAYPFWLVHMLEELEIYPASFSKYGNVYTKYIFPMIETKRKQSEKSVVPAKNEKSFGYRSKKKHRYTMKEGIYV